MKQIKYNGLTYEIKHPTDAADCLPWHLDRPEFAELIDGIRDNGFDPMKPILIQKSTGKIISGRRRALASAIAAVEPVCQVVDWDDDKVCRFVESDELIRRNLTPAERSACVAKLATMPDGSGSRGSDSMKELADRAHVSERTMHRVNEVRKNAPELIDEMAEGRLSVNTAVAVSSLPEDDRKEIVSSKEPEKAAKKKVKAKKQEAPSAGKLATYYKDQFGVGLPGIYLPRFSKSTEGQEVVLDAYDQVVPSGVGDAFADPELRLIAQDTFQLAELAESIRERVKSLKQHSNHPWLDIAKLFEDIDAIRESSVSVNHQVIEGSPYAVCPDCGGERKGCKACRTSGYWPKPECEANPSRFNRGA